MSRFVQFAAPWWVNLLMFIPAVPYLLSRSTKVGMGKKRLLTVALFGITFGFVEAAVVVYLRAATGLWPGPPAKALAALPKILLKIECCREAATMVMLGVIAFLAGQRGKERLVAFLWAFAFWDLFYYISLRLTIGWPASLLDTDILFLLPVPWLAQVWFPILVSSLTILAIWLRD